MKTSFKAIAQVSISILLLSSCSPTSTPTEDYTDQIPEHVNDVIAKLEAGGFSCENPTMYLHKGDLVSPLLGTEPDQLRCNKSDGNLGDAFSVFESESQALRYYQAQCYESDWDRGYFHGTFMISPTVETKFNAWTTEEANKLAEILGYPMAKELKFDCDYSSISW
jgi:hypothetical protein